MTPGVSAPCTPVACTPSPNAERLAVATDAVRVPCARARGTPPASLRDGRARVRLPRLVLRVQPQGTEAPQAARPPVPGRLPHVLRPLHHRLQQGTDSHALLDEVLRRPLRCRRLRREFPDLRR